MYYPIFLNLNDRKCVVVGGGLVAFRKVKSMLDCGAKVEVISPQVCDDLAKMSINSQFKIILRTYCPGDLEGASFVIAATDEPGINQQVANDGKLAKILVNVVDDAAQSDFIVPSYFSRGDVTIAVSTAGKSPALARKIRTNLEKDFGDEFAELATLISEVRSSLKTEGVRIDGDSWQKALDIDNLLDLIKNAGKDEARQQLLNELKSHNVDNGAEK